jgi:pimeloyl-ACP methyl ester carboxylesterase
MDRQTPVPALRIHGARDPLMLPETARASSRWLGDRAPLHMLGGIGHFPHEEAPTVVNHALLDFLKG